MHLNFLALLLTIVPLPGLYLRYLPFKRFIDRPQRNKMFLAYGCWFLILCGLNYYIYENDSFSIIYYKQLAMLGWLPYLAINIIGIPGHLEHHLFITGMQCLYTMILHGAAAFITIQIDGSPDVLKFGYLQSFVYLGFFALTFPLIRKFFTQIFWSEQAFQNKSYWRSVCLLPFLLAAISITSSYSDDILVPELTIPRIILLGTFISLIVAFSNDILSLEEQADLDAGNKFLGMQLSSLKDHTRLIEESSQKMAIFRHDIRHYNLLLAALVKEGKKEEALRFITDCDNNISQTAVQTYCANPIINAALAVYLQRAKTAGIPLKVQFGLPAELNLDENELAILICNLLENAIRASLTQAAPDRQINIIAKMTKQLFFMAVENRFRETVPLGEDGLPVTSRSGHGLGMRSLAAFKTKHQAHVLCGQQDGWFRTIIRINLSSL